MISLSMLSPKDAAINPYLVDIDIVVEPKPMQRGATTRAALPGDNNMSFG
jgi:hypothetical protein